MSTGAWIVLIIAVLVVVAYESNGGGESSGSDGGGGGIGASVSDILSALSKQEGVNPSHNNPGAICGSYTNGICNGPKTFPTLAQGEAAAEALIQKILDSHPGITLRDFVTYWTNGPGAIGQPASAALNNYINGVSSTLGQSPDDPIEGSSSSTSTAQDFVDDGSDDDGTYDDTGD